MLQHPVIIIQFPLYYLSSGLSREIKVAEHSFWYLCFIHLFSKTLDLSVVKNGHKLVNNTNFGFLMAKLTYVPLPWQHK